MAATHPSSPDTAAEATTGGNNAVKSAATSDDDATSSSAATSSQQSTNQKSNDMTHTTKSSPSPSPSSNTNNMPLPTYLSTKSSKAYTMSKQLLSSGSLDDALSTLEMTLQLSREILVSSLNHNKNDNSTKPDIEEDDVNIELHESLAPLYYLYGTTLLYSVEESDVMMAATNDQTKVTNGGAPSDIDVSPEEEDDDNMKLPSQDDEFVDASEQPSFGGFGEDYEEEHGAAEVQEISDPAEDLQIAWENLDLARTIVTRLVDEFKPSTNNNGTNNNNNNTVVLKSDEGNLKNDETLNPIEEIVNNGIKYTSTQQTNLLLDLAQIHTRLGDLQRANANILPCIDDYNLALELRTKCLGKFDKKVADSHFSLGQVYAEAPNRVGENEGMVSEFVNSLGGAPCPTLHEEQCDGGCWDKIRGTEYKSPHGIPLDLLDRLMI